VACRVISGCLNSLGVLKIPFSSKARARRVLRIISNENHTAELDVRHPGSGRVHKVGTMNELTQSSFDSITRLSVLTTPAPIVLRRDGRRAIIDIVQPFLQLMHGKRMRIAGKENTTADGYSCSNRRWFGRMKLSIKSSYEANRISLNADIEKLKVQNFVARDSWI
jgi:hypothetical protein